MLNSSSGVSPPSTSDFRRFWCSMIAILAGMDSSHLPLQNPGGLVKFRCRKRGAVVVNSSGGGDATSNGHNRRFRRPNKVIPVALDSCVHPLSNHVKSCKLWLSFDTPPNHYPHWPIMGVLAVGAVSGHGGCAREVQRYSLESPILV